MVGWVSMSRSVFRANALLIWRFRYFLHFQVGKLAGCLRSRCTWRATQSLWLFTSHSRVCHSAALHLQWVSCQSRRVLRSTCGGRRRRYGTSGISGNFRCSGLCAETSRQSKSVQRRHKLHFMMKVRPGRVDKYSFGSGHSHASPWPMFFSLYLSKRDRECNKCDS